MINCYTKLRLLYFTLEQGQLCF